MLHPFQKIEMTPMLRKYLLKFALRIAVFLAIFCVWLINKPSLWQMLTTPVSHGISPVRILWLVFMIIMISHIFPTQARSMTLRKRKEETYRPAPHEEVDLLRFTQQMNARAWIVMLIWLSMNAVFGLLYLMGVLVEADLFMLTVFFFLCDYICILLFCPFQTFIMKNRCCVNCRIYDWGHFMMFTPMLFIRDFFSWSLFFTSVVVLIRWEIVYARHPERFWHGSNRTLQCAECRDKTCQLKRTLHRGE